MLFDSHAHYDDDAFDFDRAALLEKLPRENVSFVVNVGCDLESSKYAIELAEKYPYIYAGVGIHPSNADKVKDNELDEIKKLAGHPKVVAIGEIGLDYHYETPEREPQHELYRALLQVARECGLPVSVHDREAHADSISIAREFPEVRGVFHCFSGSVETMRELVGMGWYIGFTGIVTFKNAKKIAAVAAAVPEERILIETDCPYLAPDPVRGSRCDSSLLKYTGARIAELRGVTAEHIYSAALGNARRFFNI